MRSIDCIGLYSRTLSFLVLLTLTISFSMVSLAATRPVGELTVRPVQTVDGASVIVDGQIAASGRTVFASSVIVTPDEFGATLNLGRLGKIDLGPATRFVLSKDGDDVLGDLHSGTVTAFGSQPIAVRTANGSVVRLEVGQSVNADSSAPAQTKSSSSFPAWGWAAIIGVVVGVTVIALAAGGGGGNNNNNTSPIR